MIISISDIGEMPQLSEESWGFELFEVLEEPNDEAEMLLFGGLLLPMVTPEMVYFD